MAGAVCARLGLPFRALEWEGHKPRRGLPAAARAARHRLLADAARGSGASVVLMGHTRDDVLESALMRQEGSTLGALRPFAPSPVWPEGRGVFILRPLLGLGRSDLRGLLAGTGLDWIEDPANDDPAFARARARRALAALPRAAGAIEAQADDGSALSDLAASARIDRFGVIRIGRDALLAAPPDAAARFISIACVCAGGGERPPRARSAARLRDRIGANERFTASLAGARVQAGDRVEIMRDPGEAYRRGAPSPIRPIPGQAEVFDGRFEVIADSPNVQVRPLAGLAARLDPAQRRALKPALPAARRALPALVGPDGTVTCAILAQGPKAPARLLVAERFGAACGAVVREGRLSAADGGEAPGVLS